MRSWSKIGGNGVLHDTHAGSLKISRGKMNVSRHISIDDEYLRKMEPYLNKHNGNMGAALRDIINQAGRYTPRMNSSAIDISLLDWMLREINDILVPNEVLDKLIDPRMMNSMEMLENYINERLCELEWDVRINIKCDNVAFPSSLSIELRGTPQKIKFIAGLLSQFIVKNSLERSPLEIQTVTNLNEYIKVDLSRSNKTASMNSLTSYFGGLNGILRTIKDKPEFWISVIKGHLLSNYNMVTVHRNYFEDILANNIPVGEVTLEFLAKKPIYEIELKDFLLLIKEVYEKSRIVDRVEIDKDKLIFFHDYRTKEAVERLEKIILTLLESNGHLYESKSTANMIVLTPRHDINIQINGLIDNLKTSSNRVDQELLMFITYLSGLRDIPDILLSTSVLGRRFGKSIMQEYEKENNIKKWTLDTLKSAFETIDSRLHRNSKCTLDGKSLHYTVKECNIARYGVDIDPCICHAIRETFKGAMIYAFGDKAEMDVQKLLSQGDDFCEVVIRIQ